MLELQRQINIKCVASQILNFAALQKGQDNIFICQLGNVSHTQYNFKISGWMAIISQLLPFSSWPSGEQLLKYLPIKRWFKDGGGGGGGGLWTDPNFHNYAHSMGLHVRMSPPENPFYLWKGAPPPSTFALAISPVKNFCNQKAVYLPCTALYFIIMIKLLMDCDYLICIYLSTCKMNYIHLPPKEVYTLSLTNRVTKQGKIKLGNKR